MTKGNIWALWDGEMKRSRERLKDKEIDGEKKREKAGCRDKYV